MKHSIYFVWGVACVLFAWGLYLRMWSTEPVLEALLFITIASAQSAAFRRFHKRATTQNALAVIALAWWALLFLLRGLDLIGDAATAVCIAAFAILVLLAHRRDG